MKRRTFLVRSGLLMGAPAAIIRQSSARSVSHGTRFPLSVASGDPTADAVVPFAEHASAVECDRIDGQDDAIRHAAQ
ncbi:hypothetical protein [Pandoraea sputorum]|uniref:hypothetical protein n=1 Tax=Pandoraea sputorum TaxID=93222 RepID=UPI00125A97FD|nr:hypothetical protein [Pandoraea sputorum]VVE81687.1 hypothetical protein PSP31120_03223 [Pandoraea sputorum]